MFQDFTGGLETPYKWKILSIRIIAQLVLQTASSQVKPAAFWRVSTAQGHLKLFMLLAILIIINVPDDTVVSSRSKLSLIQSMENNW